MWRRVKNRLGCFILASLFWYPLCANASTATWQGTVSADSSIELLFLGTLAADSSYLAEANIEPNMPASNCFYSSCGLPGTYFTSWQVSTTASVNGNSFAVTNHNCSSPDSCAAEPPFGGFTGGVATQAFLISMGSLYADACVTTYSGGTSQSCVGPVSGMVDLTLNISDALGDFLVVTPIPSTLPMFSAGLALLGVFVWGRRRAAVEA